MHDRNSTNCTVTIHKQSVCGHKSKKCDRICEKVYILLGKKKYVFVLVIATKIYNRLLATF